MARINHPKNGNGLILQNTANEEEAFDKFFELLDEFLALNGMSYVMPQKIKEKVNDFFWWDYPGQPNPPIDLSRLDLSDLDVGDIDLSGTGLGRTLENSKQSKVADGDQRA